MIPIGIGALLGAGINAGALSVSGTSSTALAAILGVVLFLLILLRRRFDVARWPIVVLYLATLAGALILGAWLFNKNPALSTWLRLVPAQPPDMMAVFERMLTDHRWSGSGAGTFEAMARIYQNSEMPNALKPPSTTIALLIELGTIGLIGATAIAAALFVKLFSGALRRGRDWFFPAAGAACVAIAACEAFVGSGLLQPAVATVLAIIVGLGLSQSFSQSAPP